MDVPGRDLRKRFGNLILSRLPVTSARRHALPWPADPDVDSMPRVAVEAVVPAPFGALRVTTTHLEYYSTVQRMAQARRLRELHDEACARAMRREPPSRANRTRPSTSRRSRPPRSSPATSTSRPRRPSTRRSRRRSTAAGPRYRDAWAQVHGLRAHVPTFCVHDRSWRDTPYCCDFVFSNW